MKNRNLLETRESTSARSRKASGLPLLSLVVVLGLSLSIIGSGTAQAFSPSDTTYGTVGFITHDGLFFVQVGYVGYLLKTFIAVPNGSQVFAYATAVNVTSIVDYNATAYIRVFSFDLNRTISNLTVPLTPYATSIVEISLPVSHDYLKYRISVDATPAVYWYQSPYSFLSIPNLQDGGVDLIAVVIVAEFLVIGLPLWVKAERMTKRAIYCPKWNATVWLHGIVIGMLAWYIVAFPSINSFFKGTEWAFIPLPEILFLFFWTAGRHSTHKKVEFRQMVPRLGHRLGEIRKVFFMGQDQDGDLVIMRSKSIFQWLYRAWGHHVKVFRRLSTEMRSPAEPMHIDSIDLSSVPPSQFRDPARFPRGARYDAMDDIPVLNPGDDDGDGIERVYYVPRISQMLVKWPHWAWTREVSVPSFVDKEGNTHPATTKKKFSPHVEDGYAEVTLIGWHGTDIYAMSVGHMRYEDAVMEIEDLEVRVAIERGKRHTETGRRAEEMINAEDDIRERPFSELSDEELKSLVPPSRGDEVPTIEPTSEEKREQRKPGRRPAGA